MEKRDIIVWAIVGAAIAGILLYLWYTGYFTTPEGLKVIK